MPTYHALYITTNVQNCNTSSSVPRSSPSGNISNLSIDAFQIQKGRFAHHTFTCRSDQVRSGLFFCRRKYKWTSKMIWRSFDNLKKPPRLLYAFSFDGYSASTTAFSIQEHLTIRNWQCKHITKINRITVYPFTYKRVNRYIRRGSLAFSREPLLPSCRPLQLHSNK